MYWLIEDYQKIDILCKVKHQQAYVEVIPLSHNQHPIENNICALYVRPLTDTKGYIIPINHSETINLEIECCLKVLNSIENIFVRDKKEFLHYFCIKHCYQPTPSPTTYIPQQTQAHTHIYNNYTNIQDLNALIPIVKHYEVCEQNYANFKREFNPFYNKAAIAFNQLERTGIKVDPVLFEQYFDKEVDEFVYTQYNLNTLTTRPSNTFGGINFSTLNKDNGERKCFIPRNDIFVEMDISAYHPTLLAVLCDYTFDNVDIHRAFAEMYDVDYAKAKEITFKQIYGGIWKEYEELEFFKKVKTYTDNLWGDFKKQGFIKCPISGYKFKDSELENMNPQKLLNYVLQNLETANNVLILWEIFKILRGKNTKLVLYVYDSFLFDFDESETEVMEDIVNVFKDKKLQTKHKKGINYSFI